MARELLEASAFAGAFWPSRAPAHDGEERGVATAAAEAPQCRTPETQDVASQQAAGGPSGTDEHQLPTLDDDE
jgi:hypothetical protein